MPWQPRNLMGIKREFLELALQEGANRRELCRRFGISPNGVVTLAEAKRKTAMRDRCSKCDGRILGAAGESTPRVETRGKLLAIERGAQQMALQRKVLADG